MSTRNWSGREFWKPPKEAETWSLVSATEKQLGARRALLDLGAVPFGIIKSEQGEPMEVFFTKLGQTIRLVYTKTGGYRF